MIASTTTVRLNIILLRAFRYYCDRIGAETGPEGVRAMIRDLPEYKELENNQNPTQLEQESQEKITQVSKIT